MPTSFSTLIARPRSKPFTATLMSLGSPTAGVMESGATCGPTKVSRAANKRQNALCKQRLVEPSETYRLLLSPLRCRQEKGRTDEPWERLFQSKVSCPVLRCSAVIAWEELPGQTPSCDNIFNR